jgi:hypothetical protein
MASSPLLQSASHVCGLIRDDCVRDSGFGAKVGCSHLGCELFFGIDGGPESGGFRDALAREPLRMSSAVDLSRVEMWRGGLGAAYRWPALSSAGASLAVPCSVSTSRSSNRTGGFTASGSRRRLTVSPTEGWRSAVQAGPDQTLRATGHPDNARFRDPAVCVWRTATG